MPMKPPQIENKLAAAISSGIEGVKTSQSKQKTTGFGFSPPTITMEDALSLIDRLQHAAARRHSWDNTRELLVKLVQSHPFTMFDSRVRFINTVRARVFNEFPPITNVSLLGPRAIDDIKDYGRCHKPGSSIYYGANNTETALVELQPNVGDQVYMLTSTYEDSMRIRQLVVGEFDHFRRTGESLVRIDASKEDLTKRLSTESHDTRDHITILVDAFLAEMFLEPAVRKDEYKRTSALADILYNSPMNASAIYYQSVAQRGGINIAMKADVFLQNAKHLGCELIEIVSYYGYGLYGKRRIAKSQRIEVDGTIIW